MAPRCGLNVTSPSASSCRSASRIGNAAHAELVGERVLPQRLAFGVVAVEDAVADRLERHARDGLALQRHDADVGVVGSRRRSGAGSPRAGAGGLRRAGLVGARHRPDFWLRGVRLGYNIHGLPAAQSLHVRPRSSNEFCLAARSAQRAARRARASSRCSTSCSSFAPTLRGVREGDARGARRSAASAPDSSPTSSTRSASARSPRRPRSSA